MAQSDWYIQPSAGRFVAVQAQADAVASPSFLTPIFSCRRASLHTAHCTSHRARKLGHGGGRRRAKHLKLAVRFAS